MTKSTCNGVTSAGQQCRRLASDSGYCSTHDPALIAARKKSADLAAKKSERLNEVLGVLAKVCEARGWSWRTEVLDEQDYKYASISVRREYSDGTVVGSWEITLDAGVRMSLQKTSFYSHGIDELAEAGRKALLTLPWLEPVQKASSALQVPAATRLGAVLRRFHVAVRQLQRRHEDRGTLVVQDEYDVQDFLHTLIRALFDDVRPEEATPSYAGGSSRMDFLLKAEEVVVETKVASSKLRDKAIGDQLLVDIQRYQAHPACKQLICFVYDPAGHIRNPDGLERDLSGKNGNIHVTVIVNPK